MAVKLPNGAYFDVGTVSGSPIVMSALSNAADAVATLAEGHGLVVGDTVVVQSGWKAVSNRLAQVTAVTGADVTLGKVNTADETRFAPGRGAGHLAKVAASDWTEINQVLTVAMAGGEQQNRTFQFLEDDDEEQLPTVKSARSITLTLADDPELPWNEVLLDADDDKEPRPIRLRLRGGGAVYYYARIGFNNVPTLNKNEEMTVSTTFNLIGKPIRYVS